MSIDAGATPGNKLTICLALPGVHDYVVEVNHDDTIAESMEHFEKSYAVEKRLKNQTVISMRAFVGGGHPPETLDMNRSWKAQNIGHLQVLIAGLKNQE